MSAARPRRARGAMATLAALVVASCVLGAGPIDDGARAGAATSVNRAVVIVDLGDEVKTEGITFTEDSISGIEALQRAGMEPATRGFGGTGVAVCALCGRGCPTDGSCLTCGGASYWGYWRAPAGATSYTYSPAGAGGVRVRDGDVEAWKWGSGTPPAFVSFASVWNDPPAPVPSTVPPIPPPRPPASSPPATPGGDGAGPGAGGDPGVGPSSPTPADPGEPGSDAGAGDASGGPGTTAPGAPGTGRSVAPDGPGDADGADDDASAGGPDGAAAAAAGRDARPRGPVAPVVEDPTGGSVWGVLAFGTLAAGLTGWAVWARRRRRRGAPASV